MHKRNRSTPALGLSELPYRSLRPFCRMLSRTSDGARLLELDGVLATITPLTPRRSITNSVVYEQSESLERALEPLSSAYAEADITAWTVWVPEDDRTARELLEEAGHRIDAAPAAMAIDLGEFERAPSAGLELDRDPPAADVGRINDVAYGFDGDFSLAFSRRPEELNLYAARVGGEAVSCVGSIYDEGDCGIYLVATDPGARRRGLAADLVTVALNDARAAGCGSASLQSTAIGKPVYTRLGFRDFGSIQMWEKRPT